jgi:uncharacterized protein (DUF58 family)
MLIPRYPLAVAAALPVVLALLSLVHPGVLRVAWYVDAAIVVVAVIDALLGRRSVVTVTADAPEVFSLGQPNVVRVLVRSSARRKLRVRLNQGLFRSAECADLPATVVLGARGTALTRWRVVPRARGAHKLGRIFVRYPTPLGLFERQISLLEPKEVRVYPDLASLRKYDLLAMQDREHGHFRTVRRQGGESEFERLREYSKDDELRTIDWRATARSRKLIVRQYQTESNQNLMFVLDGGRFMTATADGTTLFDHALNAALMLAHVAVRRGDRVGLLSFDDEVRAFVSPSSGAAAQRRLIKATYALDARLVESDYDTALRTLATRVRKRSLTILFTQVIDEAAARSTLRRTRSLLSAHLPLVVLLRDTEVEGLLSRPAQGSDDLYVKAAAAEELRKRDGFARELRRAGVHVLDVRAADLTASLVNRYLEIKARNEL